MNHVWNSAFVFKTLEQIMITILEVSQEQIKRMYATYITFRLTYNSFHLSC